MKSTIKCFIIKDKNGGWNKYTTESFGNLSFYASVKLGDRMWISNNRYNGLFLIDLKTEKTVFLGSFLNEEIDGKCLHKCALLYKKKIYFFPLLSEKIGIYDIELRQFSTCHLERNSNIFIQTFDIALNGNLVYIFTQTLKHGVYIYDLETYEIRKDDYIKRFLIKEGFYDIKIFDMSINISDVQFVIKGKENSIVNYNLKNNNIDFINFVKCKNICNFAKYNDYFAILDSTNKIFVENNGNDIGVFDISDFLSMCDRVINMVFANDYLLLWTAEGTIILIDIIEKIVKNMNSQMVNFEIIDDFMKDWKIAVFSGYLFEDGYLYLFPLRGSKLLRINVSKGLLKEISIKTRFKPLFNYLLMESENFMFKDFKDLLVRFDEQIETKVESIGASIFRSVI